MNEVCPKINRVCIFCSIYKNEYHCGQGIKVKKEYIYKVKDMPTCIKIKEEK